MNNRLTGGGTVITRLAVVSIMIARGELSGFVEAGMAFLKTRSQMGYDPEADLNNDGVINVVDQGIVGANFLHRCS